MTFHTIRTNVFPVRGDQPYVQLADVATASYHGPVTWNAIKEQHQDAVRLPDIGLLRAKRAVYGVSTKKSYSWIPPTRRGRKERDLPPT